jgi:serine/threonine-protein kinase HipA
MLAGKDGLRLSLAGAQDKLPVVFDGDRIGLPRNGTPSSLSGFLARYML